MELQGSTVSWSFQSAVEQPQHGVENTVFNGRVEDKEGHAVDAIAGALRRMTPNKKPSLRWVFCMELAVREGFEPSIRY